LKTIRIAVVAAVLSLVTAAGVQAQGADLASQSLRPYWHVFIAYAIVWALIGGWVISIGRRLGKLENRAGE